METGNSERCTLLLHPGRRKMVQEDMASVQTLEDPQWGTITIAVVCDGYSGAQAAMCVSCQAPHKIFENLEGLSPDATEEIRWKTWCNICEQLQDKVDESISDDSGTTATFALVFHNHRFFTVSQLGDSSAYLFHENTMRDMGDRKIRRLEKKLLEDVKKIQRELGRGSLVDFVHNPYPFQAKDVQQNLHDLGETISSLSPLMEEDYSHMKHRWTMDRLMDPQNIQCRSEVDRIYKTWLESLSEEERQIMENDEIKCSKELNKRHPVQFPWFIWQTNLSRGLGDTKRVKDYLDLFLRIPVVFS